MQQQGRTAPEAEGMNHNHSQETAVKHKASESMGDDDNSKEPSARLREEHDRKKEEDGCALEMMTEPSSSSTSTLDDFLSLSPTPLSSSLYSSMQLPTACLNEHDGCDEAELIARAKRCEEIMKLSQQAIDAEAARVKAANIKPLVWAKPTFEIDSPAADTTTDDDVAAAAAANETQAEETQEADKLGKRKGSPTNTPQHYSSYHLERLSYKPRRKLTREEVQAFAEFTDKWMPSAKRISAGSGNDDEEESE